MPNVPVPHLHDDEPRAFELGSSRRVVTSERQGRVVALALYLDDDGLDLVPEVDAPCPQLATGIDLPPPASTDDLLEAGLKAGCDRHEIDRPDSQETLEHGGPVPSLPPYLLEACSHRWDGDEAHRQPRVEGALGPHRIHQSAQLIDAQLRPNDGDALVLGDPPLRHVPARVDPADVTGERRRSMVRHHAGGQQPIAASELPVRRARSRSECSPTSGLEHRGARLLFVRLRTSRANEETTRLLDPPRRRSHPGDLGGAQAEIPKLPDCDARVLLGSHFVDPRVESHARRE